MCVCVCEVCLPVLGGFLPDARVSSNSPKLGQISLSCASVCPAIDWHQGVPHLMPRAAGIGSRVCVCVCIFITGTVSLSTLMTWGVCLTTDYALHN